jgi:hypothetical protein
MIRYIRKLGKEKIVERINAYKNNEYMPDDILSSILASYSNFFFLERILEKKLGINRD